MIAVASLDLNKRLYELKPEWDDTAFILRKYSLADHPILLERPSKGTDVAVLSGQLEWELPQFDLQYLLDKLLPEYGKITLTHDFGHNQWWATDDIGHAAFTADTICNAAALLLLELIEKGVL